MRERERESAENNKIKLSFMTWIAFAGCCYFLCWLHKHCTQKDHPQTPVDIFLTLDLSHRSNVQKGFFAGESDKNSILGSSGEVCFDRSANKLNNWIGPVVKHVWNDAICVLHIFFICHSHNSLPLGRIQR